MGAKNLNKNISVIITFDCQPYCVIENEEVFKRFAQVLNTGTISSRKG